MVFRMPDRRTGGCSACNLRIDYWQRWIEMQSDLGVGPKSLVVKLSAEAADLSELVRIVLLNGSSQVIRERARCIEAGIDGGSIEMVNGAVTVVFLNDMRLGATLMSKLQHPM